MIDMHSHIIYGLDDGAKTLEETISMLNMAYNDGIRSIIVTPHYNYKYKHNIDKLKIHFNSIQKRYIVERPDMKLYLGNECSLDESLLKDLINGKCRTLAESNYVLIEIGCNKVLEPTKVMLLDIIKNGYIPIIAHCERLIGIKRDLNYLYELSSMGCLLQINASILTKKKKWWLKRGIYNSLRSGVISFVSSDAHDNIYRKPLLKEAYNLVSNKLGIDIANNVFINNAKRIIDSAVVINNLGEP